ncbi:hypothetical protein BH11PSE9_BH11PSE9_35450 [soil metagenome]
MSRHTFSFSSAALLAILAAVPTHAAITLSAASPVYSQNFDSLATSGAGNAWANDATLPGWSLLKADGSAVATYAAGNGSSNTGAFYSFGSDSDRALGGVGSGGAYFGSPLSNTVAGYVAASFVNATGAKLAGFDIGFSGEQWRNGGNISAQTMVFAYGFGASFADVTWATPGAGFDFTSPIFGATAAAVNGDAAGHVSGLGGNVNASWDAGQTLWVRWTERNDIGSDHGLAIDNLTLSVAVTPVPEPETYALMFAGLLLVTTTVARRSR